jgi:hypothetical protein
MTLLSQLKCYGNVNQYNSDHHGSNQEENKPSLDLLAFQILTMYTTQTHNATLKSHLNELLTKEIVRLKTEK